MFISSDHLGIHYGVDHNIAKFFIDRDPPANNLYWYDKSLYVQPSPGYLFIPLITELLFRMGISKQQLLSAEFITCMEHIGHISALEETKQITSGDAIERCTEVAKAHNKNDEWLQLVVAYFNHTPGNLMRTLVTPFKALHRGDYFLFALSALEFPNDLFKHVTQLWFALISVLLLLDDAEDIYDDRKSNEENAFIESGLNKEGVENIKKLFANNLQIISAVNQPMAVKIEKQFFELLEKPHVHPLLNY